MQFKVHTIEGEKFYITAKYYSFEKDGILKFYASEPHVKIEERKEATKYQFVTRNVIAVERDAQ